LEDFVSKHGQAFPWVPGRAPKIGEQNMCFKNAANMALEQGLVYVEGFALALPAPIPVAHAWCVGEDGMVIDPTWDEAILTGEREYFGIAIKHDYLCVALVRRRMWGVMDDWEGRWPMLSDSPTQWLDVRVKSGPGRSFGKRRNEPIQKEVKTCRTGA
jgi:hypothetical protein